MPPLTTPAAALLVMVGYFFVTVMVPFFVAKGIHIHHKHPGSR